VRSARATIRTGRAPSPILAGAAEALAFAQGHEVAGLIAHVPATIDVAAIRKSRGLSQTAFAAAYGFNVARIRDWEQGRSAPDSAARAYLLVIAAEPEAVARALRSAA